MTLPSIPNTPDREFDPFWAFEHVHIGRLISNRAARAGTQTLLPSLRMVPAAVITKHLNSSAGRPCGFRCACH